MRSGLSNAARHALASDASFRRYERITHGGETYILMDALPEKEDVRPFIRMAEFLIKNGLSAPGLLAQDVKNGLLLLEDLGDVKYSSLGASRERERAFYKYAVELLVALHKIAPLSGLETYDVEKLMRECMLLTEWYLPHLTGKPAPSDIVQEYEDAWRKVLEGPALSRNVTVLRDYHADNLLWLEGRQDIRKVGVLDFQDAVIGDPAYDLVSLLEDARRDISPELAEEMIALYLECAGKTERAHFMTAYAILGAQRNCKILGIFARLARRDGKRHYLAMLPRVTGYLRRDMQHPALAPIEKWLKKNVENFDTVL